MHVERSTAGPVPRSALGPALTLALALALALTLTLTLTLAELALQSWKLHYTGVATVPHF